MVSVAEVDRLLAGLVPTPTSERIPVGEAGGRRLEDAVVADRDGPPFDRVAMDGYAIQAAMGRRNWTVQGLQVAGRPPLTNEGPSFAVEVATGAVLPEGCDTVVPYEHTIRSGNLVGLLEDRPLPPLGRHVHRAGTDYRKGDELLSRGTLLRSPHLHCLASVGLDPVPVRRRLVWSLAITGDELTEVGAIPKAWQIRRSNGAALRGEANGWGLAPRDEAVLPDEPGELRRKLDALLPGLDVLVLTGGVSEGALDLVPGTLVGMGAQTIFHKVAQRPGKPFWCGKLQGIGGRSTLVFGLPGNPVSSLFSFRRYVVPWLLEAEGRPLAAPRVSIVGPQPPPPRRDSFSSLVVRPGTPRMAGFRRLPGPV